MSREVNSNFNETNPNPACGGNYLYGRNPVIEALRSGHQLDTVYISQSAGGSISVIKALARDTGTIVKLVPRDKLDALAAGANHQGVVAICSSFEYQELDDVFAFAASRGEPPLIVILDQIEDPHNLGAIIRTAECAGFHGVIIPRRRAASVNGTVAKTSAGAIERVPIVRTNNLSQMIETLKQKGLWIAAATMDGDSYLSRDLTAPLGLIIGNEGSGVSNALLKHADFTLSIPMHGEINSLNASAAVAVLLFAIRASN